MTKSRRNNGGSALWRDLRAALGDSFEVRVRGVMRRELRLLDRSGTQAGRLRMRGLEGAELRAGDLEARIERAGAGYRMVSTSGVVLETTSPLAERMSLICGDETYEVRASPLRNAASARSRSGEVAHVGGSLPGRRYEVSLDAGDESALAVAVFLLYLTVFLRSRAYRATPARAWYKRDT